MVSGNRDIKRKAREIQEQAGVPYTLALDTAKAYDTSIKVGEMNGVELQFVLDSVVSEDDPYPYRHADLPFMAQILIPGGMTVMAWDYGTSTVEHTLEDGARVMWDYHPTYFPKADSGFGDELPAADKITTSQFDALKETQSLADLFFSDDFKGGLPTEDLLEVTVTDLMVHLKKVLESRQR